MALIRSCFLSWKRHPMLLAGRVEGCGVPLVRAVDAAPPARLLSAKGPGQQLARKPLPAHLPGPFLENSAEKWIRPKRSQGTWFQPRVLPTPTSGLKIEAKSNQPGKQFFPLRLTHTLRCLTFAPCPGESTLVTRNKELKKGVL